MAPKISFSGMWEVVKKSFKGFDEDKVTKLSASLAYYTIFSMGPLLIVIISLCGLFLGKEAVEGKIYGQLAGFVGADTAEQLQQIIKNASLAGKSKLAAIVGSSMLLIASTTVFAEIQDSINGIWGLKPKPKRGWVKLLQNRFLSFSVIVGLGFLLLVSLGVNTIVDGFSVHLSNRFPGVAIVVFYIVNVGITLFVTTLIFGVIFKVLPDATIRWKDVIAGAITTALLFMLGKFGISFYISKSHVGSTYGAAGSLVVLLLWVYYSSIILYFGAEFTKAYAVKYGSSIYPNQYAVTTKMVEVETGGQSVQMKEHATIEATAIVDGKQKDIITKTT
jgi:membrane protein